MPYRSIRSQAPCSLLLSLSHSFSIASLSLSLSLWVTASQAQPPTHALEHSLISQVAVAYINKQRTEDLHQSRSRDTGRKDRDDIEIEIETDRSSFSPPQCLSQSWSPPSSSPASTSTPCSQVTHLLWRQPGSKGLPSLLVSQADRAHRVYSGFTKPNVLTGSPSSSTLTPWT